MSTYKFLVKGSQPEPYEVSFSFDGKNLTASCNCAAGQLGQYCKHSFEILKGETASIVSNNLNEIPKLLVDFEGSPLDIKLIELYHMEEEMVKAKKHIDGLKKQIARIMSGN